MHQLGKGHASATTFSKVMNMPLPACHSAYDRTSSQLSAAAEKVASKSMTDAAVEVCRVIRNDECSVSVTERGRSVGIL